MKHRLPKCTWKFFHFYVQCRGLNKDASYVCEKANGCNYEKQIYSNNGLMSVVLPVPGELGKYGAMQIKLVKL